MENIWIIIFINAQQLLGTAELPELEIPLCSIHIARTSLAAGSGPFPAWQLKLRQFQSTWWGSEHWPCQILWHRKHIWSSFHKIPWLLGCCHWLKQHWLNMVEPQSPKPWLADVTMGTAKHLAPSPWSQDRAMASITVLNMTTWGPTSAVAKVPWMAGPCHGDVVPSLLGSRTSRSANMH